MKFTYSWLKEHLDTKASLDDVVERLTMTGLEIDKVHDRAKDLEGFVVGHVLAAEKHPTFHQQHLYLQVQLKGEHTITATWQLDPRETT